MRNGIHRLFHYYINIIKFVVLAFSIWDFVLFHFKGYIQYVFQASFELVILMPQLSQR